MATGRDRYRLLDRFETLFKGRIYRHRSNTNGDFVAREFYEDLYSFARSGKYVEGVDAGTRVVNKANKNYGINARRGDGAFGERLATVVPKVEIGFRVQRAPIVTIELGIEVKIVATTGIKQIDRVIGDLSKQVDAFYEGTGSRQPITLAVVGINHAPLYCAYEGQRTTITDGSKYRHPIQDAKAVRQRILDKIRLRYHALLFLDYSATNIEPWHFTWSDYRRANSDYTAILQRASIEYESKF